MDFVKPIGKFEPLPNLLHIGYEEARRLMGEDPAEGPVSRVMDWAYHQDDDHLRIIHIRDWHDANDHTAADHLRHFGAHCLQNTEGARFAFDEPSNHGKRVTVISSPSLNDFAGTPLASILDPFAGQPLRVGLMGVWTEAKITFLAYELRTRYSSFHVAVCSALTASSSRGQHFVSLDQLEKLLGVKVFPSIGLFLEFLGGSAQPLPTAGSGDPSLPRVEFDGEANLSPVDLQLARYLFRDSRSVKFRRLDGGFSGNVVMGTQSTDLFGHEQVTHVIKIGPQAAIGRERTAFERIESVLGNNAPRITEFADLGDRGAIKYRYASMGKGSSTTFQKLYASGLPMEKVKSILRTVFCDQLGRFYAAASPEKCNLLEHYWFSSKWSPNVRQRVEALIGGPASGETLRFPDGTEFPNVCRFYEQELDRLPQNRSDTTYFAYVHGDLNGANIIVDNHENVWLIDFFHTSRCHVLKDLIKLENDLLYIFTPVADEADFEQALSLSRLLMQVEDLGRPLPDWETTGLRRSQFQRAHETLCFLRSLYPDLVHSDRDPLQLYIGMMRYAMHTLSFDESSLFQRKWALYTGALCGEQIVERLGRVGPLRIAWLDERQTQPGRVGLTLLPGRRDYDRNLATDIEVLKKEGVTHVVSLLTEEEMKDYGIPNLIAVYEAAGLKSWHIPIVDQRVSSREEMAALTEKICLVVRQGGRVAMHCVGGLGRSGMAAACFLKRQGLSTDEAMREVRRVRSARAIETKLQEDFVREF
jgi:protein-tyrosine phosphatase/nicotinamidase-related amidase